MQAPPASPTVGGARDMEAQRRTPAGQPARHLIVKLLRFLQPRPLACSFCNLSGHGPVVPGPGVAICASCVSLCQTLLSLHGTDTEVTDPAGLTR
jgi:hypothetical protein